MAWAPSDAAVQDLLRFIHAAPTPWHAGRTIATRLQAQGYHSVAESDATPGAMGVTLRDESTVAAWLPGRRPPEESGFRIIVAHTDSPGFRVTPVGARGRPETPSLAAEIYGSPIVASWADRELTLAGRVCVATEEDPARTVTRHVAFDRALTRLPSAAIHLDRDVNRNGLRFPEHDALVFPFAAGADAGEPAAVALRQLLAEELGVAPDALLSWELALVDTQAPSCWGSHGDLIAAPRLDNLASCHAGLSTLEALSEAAPDATVVLACFDHEEIGSQTFKGARSDFLPGLLGRLAGGDAFAPAMRNSLLLSVDMAHGAHPAFPAFHDAEQAIHLNGGPAIKVNAQQRYATDAPAEAAVAALARQADVPLQRYVHRNDLPCGSTIGPILGATLGVRTLDIGTPMWSMHSARESAGARDHPALLRLLRAAAEAPALPWSAP